MPSKKNKSKNKGRGGRGNKPAAQASTTKAVAKEAPPVAALVEDPIVVEAKVVDADDKDEGALGE